MKTRLILTLTLLTATLQPAFSQPKYWQTLPSVNQNTPKEQKSKPVAYLVSNAHFDTQWNWDIQTSIDEYVKATLDRNLYLLEKCPDYIFNFEGGVKYAFMKEYYPEKYELIKKYIANGRWHISGSTWDATDANIPSPESLTRNILYGQHFYREEFGVESTDIFLPDCFGFGWTLPTVAAHCGLIGFSTQKLKWRENPFYGDAKVPFEIGLWEGIDGSRIMIVCNALNYTKKFTDRDLSYNKELQERIAENPLGLTYRYYGTGDRGGSGNLATIMAVQNGVHGDGPVQIISAESDRIFRDFMPYENHPKLPVWKSELLMDVHGTGCYTSQAAMKRYNRMNENLADAAERSSSAAEILGLQNYPSKLFADGWKRFIWHQFHDDLTGTSIPRAYEFSWNDEIICLKQFSSALESSVGAVSSLLNTKVSGTPVIVYNPVAAYVSGIVRIPVSSGGEYTVYDVNGKRLASQIIEDEDGCAILTRVSVPGISYSVLDVRKISSKSLASPSIPCRTFENSVYAVKFDENGDICSLVDKRNGREIVAEGASIGLKVFQGNLSAQWPAWEIRKDVIDSTPVTVSENVSVSLIENGPVRKTILVRKQYGESVFKQFISLYEGDEAARIDIRNEIDWATKDALLKADFPFSFGASQARYDLGIGSILRGTNTLTKYEVYAQKWADLTTDDGSYGVSILNDCKYGWDFPAGNQLRLSLIHTPGVKDRYIYQAEQDLGHHSFTYSILAHEGDFIDTGTVIAAESLNQPLKAFTADSKHSGKLGRLFSLASVAGNEVVMKAFKKAEDGDGYVVRFYETSGKPSKASVTFGQAVEWASELTGNEVSIFGTTDRFLSSDRRTLEFDIPAFGIKTIRVNFNSRRHREARKFMSIDLKYDVRTATFNAFRDEATFDGKGNSYPAELMPESLEYRGIPFSLADPTFENGMTCRGQEISLPKGTWNRVYFLAAAKDGDVQTSFRTGSSSQTVTVPNFTGFIGQWGHTGHTEGYVKDADPALVLTHKHYYRKDKPMNISKDIPYEFTYMFCIPVDIPAGASSVILPKDENVVVFAVTAVQDPSIIR